MDTAVDTTIDTKAERNGGAPRPQRTAVRSVDVIIPVRNGGDVLADQLAALANQVIPLVRHECGDVHPVSWNVLVVDNGSTDDTVAVATSWADRLPLRIVPAAHRRGINAARNIGVAASTSDLLLFCDADDRVHPAWLASMVEAAPNFDIGGGRLDEETLNGKSRRAQRPRMPTDSLPLGLGFLPFAPGANLAVWADALAAINGFNEHYLLGNDDVELSFRAQLNGLTLGWVPRAMVSYRHRDGARDLFRQFRGYARAEPMLYVAFRDSGMPRDSFLRTTRRWLRSVTMVDALWSPDARGWMAVLVGISIGRIEGSIKARTLYL